MWTHLLCSEEITQSQECGLLGLQQLSCWRNSYLLWVEHFHADYCPVIFSGVISAAQWVWLKPFPVCLLLEAYPFHGCQLLAEVAAHASYSRPSGAWHVCNGQGWAHVHTVGQPGKAGCPVQPSRGVAALLQVPMAKGRVSLVEPDGCWRFVYLGGTVGWEVIFVESGKINCFSTPSWILISWLQGVWDHSFGS